MGKSEETLSWFFALCIAVAIHAVLGLVVLSWVLAKSAQPAPPRTTQITISSLVVESAATASFPATVESQLDIDVSEPPKLEQNGSQLQAETLTALSPSVVRPIIQQETAIEHAGVAPAAHAAPSVAERTTETALADSPGTQSAQQAEAEPAVTPKQTDKVSALDLETSSGSQPYTSGDSIGSEGVAGAGTADIQTEQASQDAYNAVLDFLQTYDGGSCFAALPTLTEGNQLQIEAFATSINALEKFKAELIKATNTLPATDLKYISSNQCRALSFLRTSQNYPSFSLYFELRDRLIYSGELLQGTLANTGAGFVSLLLIDDEGTVQNLGDFIKFRQGTVDFSIPMTVQGSPVATQQMLMGLSTNSRLITARDMSGTKADDFFFTLAEELAQNNDQADLAVIAFTVQ